MKAERLNEQDPRKEQEGRREESAKPGKWEVGE